MYKRVSVVYSPQLLIQTRGKASVQMQWKEDCCQVTVEKWNTLDLEKYNLFPKRKKWKLTWCSDYLCYFYWTLVFVYLMRNMGPIMFCVPHSEGLHSCVHSDWPFKSMHWKPLLCPLENLEHITRLTVQCFLSLFGLNNVVKVRKHTDCDHSKYAFISSSTQKNKRTSIKIMDVEGHIKVEGSGVNALSLSKLKTAIVHSLQGYIGCGMRDTVRRPIKWLFSKHRVLCLKLMR